MDKREEIETEIYDTLAEVGTNSWAAAATNCLMKMIDKYVESKVIEARLEVMKNFGAV